MGHLVARQYHFESAHFLPKVPDGHKCKRVHGHNYRIEIMMQPRVILPEDGFVIDFWDIDAAVQPILDRIDHRLLNDIPGLENPTAENIAAWLASEVMASPIGYGSNRAIKLSNVTVWETDTARAIYEVE